MSAATSLIDGNVYFFLRHRKFGANNAPSLQASPRLLQPHYIYCREELPHQWLPSSSSPQAYWALSRSKWLQPVAKASQNLFFFVPSNNGVKHLHLIGKCVYKQNHLSNTEFNRMTKRAVLVRNVWHGQKVEVVEVCLSSSSDHRHETLDHFQCGEQSENKTMWMCAYV